MLSVYGSDHFYQIVLKSHILFSRWMEKEFLTSKKKRIMYSMVFLCSQQAVYWWSISQQQQKQHQINNANRIE